MSPHKNIKTNNKNTLPYKYPDQLEIALKCMGTEFFIQQRSQGFLFIYMDVCEQERLD